MASLGGEAAGGEPLVLHQVLEGLVSYDPATLQPRPALARAWRPSPDARTFTFLLRRGVRFHDGRPFTSADVLYTFNRLARAACGPRTAPTAAAPSFLLSLVVGYAEVAAACKAPALAGVVALGPDTVSVSLSEPWADFPSVLGNAALGIVPAGSDEAALASRPVGTGPYRVDQPWDGSSLRLVRTRPAGRGGVGALRFIGYADESAAYLDLVRGRLHYAPVPPGRTGDARRRFGDRGLVREIGLQFFGFNLRSPRVAPASFRLGLARAIDRQSLAAAIFKGTREPAEALAPPGLPGSEGDTCGEACRFDPDAARAAIAQAYPQGPPEVVVGVSDEGTNPALAQALAGMLSRVGVTVRIVERPLADHLRGIADGDVDLFQLGWVPPYPALDGLLWPLFQSGAESNYTRYANPDVDRLLAEARATLDPEGRWRIFREAERRVMADVPVIPLLWYRSRVAVDRRLRAEGGGGVVDGLGLTDFSRLRWAG